MFSFFKKRATARAGRPVAPAVAPAAAQAGHSAEAALADVVGGGRNRPITCVFDTAWTTGPRAATRAARARTERTCASSSPAASPERRRCFSAPAQTPAAGRPPAATPPPTWKPMPTWTPAPGRGHPTPTPARTPFLTPPPASIRPPRPRVPAAPPPARERATAAASAAIRRRRPPQRPIRRRRGRATGSPAQQGLRKTGTGIAQSSPAPASTTPCTKNSNQPC
jgi:hypothetical protein